MRRWRSASRKRPASATGSGTCRRICCWLPIATASGKPSIRPGPGRWAGARPNCSTAPRNGWSIPTITARPARRSRSSAAARPPSIRKPLSPQGRLLSLAVMDRRAGPGSHLCGRPRRHRREGRGRAAAGHRRGPAAVAEDGSGGPVDRRHRARLQQSADRHRRIAGSAADPAQSGAAPTTSRAISMRR